MRILYIDHYFGSPSMGMEFRPYYFAREWQKSGHEVLCVAASFSHLRSNQPEEVGVQIIDGLKYLILPTRSYQGNGLSRVFNMVEFIWGCFTKAKKTILDFKPDLVIAASTYTWDNWVAGYYAKKCGVEYVYELHDIWPLSPMELGGMSKWHPFIWLLQRAENFACKHADKVISVLPAADQHLIEHGMSPEKFVYVPNGVNPEEWTVGHQSSSFAKSTKDKPATNHRFTVGYVGGHALSNALDTLIEAAARLPDVRFVLVGKGAEKERLRKRVAVEKLGNVEFRDPVKKTDVPKVLQEFDCLYIGWTKSPLYRFGISPNKIYDYMMSGKPIIHAVEAANDPVKDAECGISCKPESVEELVDAIRTMKALPAGEASVKGMRGREYILKNNLLPDLARRFLKEAGV